MAWGLKSNTYKFKEGDLVCTPINDKRYYRIHHIDTYLDMYELKAYNVNSHLPLGDDYFSKSYLESHYKEYFSLKNLLKQL